MPLRPGDSVTFVGAGPGPTPESWQRHEPDGIPRPGDRGEVIAVRDDAATVAWTFGRKVTVPLHDLHKDPIPGPLAQYRVSFQSWEGSHDIEYVVRTNGGQSKAVWLASRRLAAELPDFLVCSVEVEAGEAVDVASTGDAIVRGEDTVVVDPLESV